MPWDEVMSKFAKGKLHSGSKKGPAVKSRAQAIAIMMSERRDAEDGKDEYRSTRRRSKAIEGLKKAGKGKDKDK